MRIHGRGGIAYLSVRNGDEATPAAFLTDWSAEWTRAVFDTTSIVDVQVLYTAGSSDASGSFKGYYDTSTAQTYAAAVDGLPRNMYIYPAAANLGQFISGMVVPDYELGGGTGAAVALSATWFAVGSVTETSGGTYGAVYAATYS